MLFKPNVTPSVQFKYFRHQLHVTRLPMSIKSNYMQCDNKIDKDTRRVIVSWPYQRPITTFDSLYPGGYLPFLIPAHNCTAPPLTVPENLLCRSPRPEQSRRWPPGRARLPMPVTRRTFPQTSADIVSPRRPAATCARPVPTGRGEWLARANLSRNAARPVPIERVTPRRRPERAAHVVYTVHGDIGMRPS